MPLQRGAAAPDALAPPWRCSLQSAQSGLHASMRALRLHVAHLPLAARACDRPPCPCCTALLYRLPSRGTVCVLGSTEQTATVVCRELGLGAAGELKSGFHGYGAGVGPIHLAGVRTRPDVEAFGGLAEPL